MSRNADQRIADILASIERCQRYLYALDSDDPKLSDMAEDAIARNLQIIGEAANHLPPQITAAHPEVPWPQVGGFRNILVHQYFGVDLEILRDVVETHLTELASALSGDVGR